MKCLSRTLRAVLMASRKLPLLASDGSAQGRRCPLLLPLLVPVLELLELVLALLPPPTPAASAQPTDAGQAQNSRLSALRKAALSLTSAAFSMTTRKKSR